MELKKEVVQMEKNKGTAFTQVTFDETYHLPDYLPDFSGAILTGKTVRLDESKAGPGHVMVKGAMKFKILYRTEQTNWNLSSLEGEYPFQETLVLETVNEFDMPQVELVLEDLTVQMMNARRLNIRALLEIRVSARERRDLELPVGLEGDDTAQVLMQESVFLELCERGKERNHIREEIKIPSNKPNIRQILWQQSQVLGMQTKVSDGTVSQQGEIQLVVVYLGEDEGPIQWLETKVPFQCQFSVPQANTDVIANVSAVIQELKVTPQPDGDGEERQLLVEGDLLADVRLYRERREMQLADVYALDRNLVAETKLADTVQLLMKNESNCRVNDTIQIQNTDSDILQICTGFGEVEVVRREIIENGISVEGTVRVQVLYLTNSDQVPLGAMEGLIPFQCVVEIPGITPDSTVELQSGLALLSFLMKSSKELEAQAVISIQAFVTEEHEKNLICGIKEEEQRLEEQGDEPGMVGLIVSSTDTLWNIAKQYHTTTEAVKTLNQLGEDPLREGMKLLLIKEFCAK
jgi:hypothetical protein